MPHKGTKAYLKKQRALNKQINNNETKPSKRAKIIVRNLPFKNLSEKTLEDIFKEYGEIEEIKLLRKDDGKFVGCGFIQFKTVSSAAKAIYFANRREINGRQIVIDWAIPKDTYLEKIKKQIQEKEFSTQVKNEETSDNENDIEISIDKKPDTWASENESGSDSDSDTEENESDSMENDSKTEEKFVDKCGKTIKKEEKQSNKSLTPRPSDAEDGKTIFIRNVPFSCTNNDVRECFEKYGAVQYALICIDKLTEHSKGTAFVKYKDEESAKLCLKDSGNIYLQDDPLTVTYALTKENLENKKSSSKKKVAKDSRNLYLVREGVITAGSKAATGVSASDMSKRLQLEQWKSQILKNLNMFVSRTRLVIHNLPPSYDDAKLKQLFMKYSNPKTIIKEAKVMWEKQKLDSRGKHISKEVGFVSFANHEDALTALRRINNNPEIFTPNKRPIVAFSIENKAVLNQKQKRIEKSREKLGITIDSKLSKLNRKQRRFIRRRQKIIEQRREAKKLKQEQEGETNANETVVKQKKRKNREDDKKVPSKKQKLDHSETEKDDGEFKAFTGITSEPGKKVKLRSRFNLKKQAIIHSQTLKKEKKNRQMKEKRYLEPIRQPRQKQRKRKLLDDSKLSKLISKHRESVRNSSSIKKWYES